MLFPMKPAPDLTANLPQHAKKLLKQAKQAKRLKDRREWFKQHADKTKQEQP